MDAQIVCCSFYESAIPLIASLWRYLAEGMGGDEPEVAADCGVTGFAHQGHVAAYLGGVELVVPLNYKHLTLPTTSRV